MRGEKKRKDADDPLEETTTPQKATTTQANKHSNVEEDDPKQNPKKKRRIETKEKKVSGVYDEETDVKETIRIGETCELQVTDKKKESTFFPEKTSQKRGLCDELEDDQQTATSYIPSSKGNYNITVHADSPRTVNIGQDSGAGLEFED